MRVKDQGIMRQGSGDQRSAGFKEHGVKGLVDHGIQSSCGPAAAFPGRRLTQPH